MMKINPLPATFVAFLFLAFGANAQGVPPTPVNVAQAQMSDIFPSAWVSGTVVSNNDAKIAAEVSGRLVEVAAVGQRVDSGQAVARIDDTVLKLAVAEQQAVVAGARHNYRFLAQEVKRKSALAKQNLSARNDLDLTINNRDVAQAKLAQEEARLAQAKQRLAYAIIKAPFDGVVTKRLGHLGEVVASGTQVVQLVETGTLEVTAQVPLTAYRYLKQGMSLDIKSSLGNGKGSIRTVVPVADERSHLVELRLQLNGGRWPVGLDVRVAVPSGPSTTQLLVPRDAVVLRREGNAVFRINVENKAERVAVTLGVASGEMIAVGGELKAGDKVVIRGSERLQPGQTVLIKDNNDKLVSLQGE